MKRDLLSDVIKLGLAAGVIALALPDAAFAQTLQASVSTVKTGMTDMPTILSGIAYLGGGATMMHGAGLLKKHADNPQSAPLAAGLSRLAIGGVVAALPVALQFMGNTLAQNGSGMTFNKMGQIQ